MVTGLALLWVNNVQFLTAWQDGGLVTNLYPVREDTTTSPR